MHKFKKKIIQYRTTWISIKYIMLSEIVQSQKDEDFNRKDPTVPKIVKLIKAECRICGCKGLRGKEKFGVVIQYSFSYAR